jgi:SAM-dependent methyltransferase
MNHQDHVALLKGGVPSPGGIWAEFGSGRGVFTIALAELIGPGGTIYSLDKDEDALRQQARGFRERFPDHSPKIHYIKEDYRNAVNLPALDGVVMANTLHFIKEKIPVLHLILGYLHPGGCLILVEYNSDARNTWVPYPLSYTSWQSIAGQAGFERTRQLDKVPSRFMGEIYSAASYKKR